VSQPGDRHDEAPRETVQQIRGNLVGAELLAKFGRLALPIGDLEQAKRLARAAAAAIDQGCLGYCLLLARR
jgi:hypothetical protein